MSAEMKVVISGEDKGASATIDKVQSKAEKLGDGAGGAIGRLTGRIDELAKIGVPGMGMLSDSFGKVETAQSSFLGRAAGLWAAGGVAIAAGLGMLGKAAIDAASESEQAEVRLTSALKATGRYSEEAVKDVGAWANALLEAKGTSDELAMSLVGQGATMGLTIEQSKRFVSAAADMEDIIGSVAGGFDILSRAATGDERALLTLGKQFGISKTEGLAFEELLEKIEERTNGNAAAKIETFAGSWKLVGDKLGNVAEVIGAKLLPAFTGLAQGTSSFIDWMMGHDPAATKELESLKKFLDQTGPAAAAAKPPVEALDAALKRSLGNAKVVADSWKDSLSSLEKNFATATANIKTKQAEFEAWIDKVSANAAARKAGGAAIGAAGQTDGQRQAQAEQQAQQLILEATRETGEKRIELLNQAAEYYEKTKAAEVAADLAAMQQMAINDSAQYERDFTSLQAALQAKAEMYMAEQQRLSAWIAEESASRANEKAAELQTAVDQASAVEAKISEVRARIADVGAEITHMDALLKDEKTLAINAEAAKADMALLLDNVTEADAAVKAPHDFKLETAAAAAEAKKLRERVDKLFPPEGLHRVVVIEYKTKASPIRPFGEGMDAIEKRMNSLPTGMTYTISANGIPSDYEARTGVSANGIPLGSQNRFQGMVPLGGGGAAAPAAVNLTANITINGGVTDGARSLLKELLKEMDKGFADLYRSNRSLLRVAIEGAAA